MHTVSPGLRAAWLSWAMRHRGPWVTGRWAFGPSGRQAAAGHWASGPLLAKPLFNSQSVLLGKLPSQDAVTLVRLSAKETIDLETAE